MAHVLLRGVDGARRTHGLDDGLVESGAGLADDGVLRDVLPVLQVADVGVQHGPQLRQLRHQILLGVVAVAPVDGDVGVLQLVGLLHRVEVRQELFVALPGGVQHLEGRLVDAVETGGGALGLLLNLLGEVLDGLAGGGVLGDAVVGPVRGVRRLGRLGGRDVDVRILGGGRLHGRLGRLFEEFAGEGQAVAQFRFIGHVHGQRFVHVGDLLSLGLLRCFPT